MDGFEADVLRRLPLLEAVVETWRAAVSDRVLGEVFESARGRSYKRTLTFPELVGLFADAVVNYAGSGRQAMLHAQRDKRLNVSPQAAYGKLRRVPLEVSRGLLERCTQRLRSLLPGPPAPALPASLRGFSGVVIDGKTIKGLHKRLKATRGAKGGLLGGRVLAALHMGAGLIISMQADQDGYAHEAALLEGLLPATRELVPGPRLYMLDRHFCFLAHLDHLTCSPRDAFIVRRRKDAPFEDHASIPAREGADEQGRLYREQWGFLRTKQPAKERPVRMITLKRPGEEEVQVVTNLLDAARYPAADILAAYLDRWTIERVFQQITEVFGLQHLIGSSPCAAIFQFALCALWYNVIQIVKAHAARGGDMTAAEVSGEQIFMDTRRQLTALTELTGLEMLTKAIPKERPLEEVRDRLLRTLPPLWNDRWRRAKTKRRTPSPHTGQARDHASAFRLMQKASARSPPSRGQ